MKIAYSTISVNPNSPSGSLDYFSEMARLLPMIDKDNEYYFITTGNSKDYFNYNYPNLNIIHIQDRNDSKIKRIFVEQFILPKILKEHKIDILFSSSGGGIAPLLLSSKTKIVLGVFATHHLKNNYLDWKVKIYRSLFFILSLKKAKVVLTNSHFTKSEILLTNPSTKGKIRIIYHGIDDHIFNNNPLTNEEENSLLKFDLKKKYILFVSIIYKYKNVHTLVEAFGQLSKKLSFPLDLILVGDFEKDYERKTNYKNQLLNIAENYGIKNAVKFIGLIKKDKLRPFYKNALAYVQPSFYETFGKTVIEAMACGCPVVGSNTSSTPEIVGSAGLLFNPFDAGELAKTLEKIVNDENLRMDLINKGYERARLFSLHDEAVKVSEIYHEVFQKS